MRCVRSARGRKCVCGQILDDDNRGPVMVHPDDGIGVFHSHRRRLCPDCFFRVLDKDSSRVLPVVAAGDNLGSVRMTEWRRPKRRPITELFPLNALGTP